MHDITEQEYKTQIEGKNKGLYLLVFHALWCPPCRMFKGSLEQLSEKNDVTVYRADVDSNKTLAGEFNVSSIPTWFIFKEGKVVYTGSGYLPYEELKKVVNEYK